jgi:FKBP-type peptidyl-prolyl cis-trans isomerase FkpA
VRRLLALGLLALAGQALAGDPDEGKPTAPPPVLEPEARLEIQELAVGTGAIASEGQSLVVEYTGWLRDLRKKDGKGRKFDSSVGREPFEFVLGTGHVIRGWELGIDGMRVGGRRRLIIPAQLAYGARGAGGGLIPPFATLIFEVELVAVAAP